MAVKLSSRRPGAAPDASSSISGTTADAGIGREKNSERLTVGAAPSGQPYTRDKERIVAVVEPEQQTIGVS